MIEPSVVTLAAGEKAMFAFEGSDWSLSPSLGDFSLEKKTYTAPRFIFNSRAVYLTVRKSGATEGTAQINLTSSLFWLSALSIYWSVLFLFLLLWGAYIWPGASSETVLMVNPPAVTLGSSQTQQFAASLNDVPEQDVTWSATLGSIMPGGFYTAPAHTQGTGEQTVTITATRNSDKTRTATAVVILSKGPGLFLYPALSHVQRGGTVKLSADGGDVDVQWPQFAPKGVYTAPSKIESRQFQSISVTDGRNAGHVASARIVLMPDGTGGSPRAASDRSLITLAFLAGAFGAWLASVNSFIGFVGNKSFVPSWGFFYFFRPFFGAGLALVVHLAHRMGSVGTASSAGNAATVAFYSALVGLFSGEALQKLHDIFCTVFGVQDKRNDKMGAQQPDSPAPVVTVAAASQARKEVSVDGANFATGCTLLIDKTAVPVSFVNDNKLTAKIDPIPAAGAEVKVRNPDGKVSEPVKLKVES